MITLEEYLEKQKKAKFLIPEKVMLTNNRELGAIVGWEPSDQPEFITIELHPNYASLIKSFTIRVSIITRIEERHVDGRTEFWIWISHHKLATELSQSFVRKIIMGVGR
ncbi:MAG: hypothetical protein ACTSYD_11705 [Candidatus Heimdallarchaeaceae archaeon]